MPTLYITDSNATLRRSGNHLIVTGPTDRPDAGVAERSILDIKTHHLDAITLVGNTHITSNASQFCLRRGIPVSWLSYEGEFLGRMTPEMDRNAGLRLAQSAIALDDEQRLEFAKTIVAAKCFNAAKTLDALRSNHSKKPAIIKAIKALYKRKTIAEKITSIEKLRGVEGINARLYFEAFKECFISEIKFQGRRKYPAPDPANAMLSLGYTLFANLITGAILARGLDPAVGFYHEPRSGRASLALDMLEEFRHPVVDRFVLSLANRKMIRPEHFKERKEKEGAIILNSKGRKIFFTEWEKRIRKPIKIHTGENHLAPIDIARRQVDTIAKAIFTADAYQPFLTA